MRILVTAIALLAAVAPIQAMAYIDPGSGSAIMSAIIGFFVAIAMVVKTYWYKIKSLFTGSKPAVDDLPQQESVDVLQTNSATSEESAESTVDKAGRHE